MQDFKTCFGLDLSEKRRLNNLVYSIGFKIKSNLLFHMAPKCAKCDPDGIKRAFIRTFLFQKNLLQNHSETTLAIFLEFFRNKFDSLQPKKPKTIAILFSLRRGRKAFQTIPNGKEVCQNRSK